MRQTVAAAILILSWAMPSLAVEPGELLADPALEARARTISAELRCLVCQNQSIDDSNAPLAKDLRLLVRERLTAGESDSAVMAYVVARYGDFVLLKPPFNSRTLLLWVSPFLVLVGIAYALTRASRKTAASPAAATAAPLSPAEENKLRELLEKR
ncbi:MAG: cytochrome c-type biogenesis protein [Hyphomicrobiaceae bacterium]